MKRSEINDAILGAEEFFAGHKFQLPAFARFTLQDWKEEYSVLQ